MVNTIIRIGLYCCIVPISSTVTCTSRSPIVLFYYYFLINNSYNSIPFNRLFSIVKPALRAEFNDLEVIFVIAAEDDVAANWES